MRLPLIILAFLFFHLCTEVQAQWSIKHLDEKENSYWNHIIKFKNDSLGLSVGNNSVVLKSVDAGETWRKVVLKTKLVLRDFQFVGDSMVFAIGNNGTVSQFIKSFDNGETWNSIASFPGEQLYSISFPDNKTGVVAGYDGIYRTTDSGNHWDLVWSIPQFGYQYGSLKKICFPATQIGYAIGQGRTQSGSKNLFDNFLLKTTDSGLNWDTIRTFGRSLTPMYFLNADTGFIGTESNVILKTTDGGHTWSKKDITDLYNNLYNNISSIHFISDRTGFATGGVQLIQATGGSSLSTFFVSKTIDGGDTWETFNSPGIPLNSIYFVNDTVGFVSGQYSLIMKSKGKINELPANYPWHLVDDGSVVKDINDPNSFVKIFPNPTTGLVTIQLKNSAQPVENIRLLNSSGQMIDLGNTKLTGEKIQIDLSRLGSGIYFLQLTFSNKSELIKVLKN